MHHPSSRRGLAAIAHRTPAVALALAVALLALVAACSDAPTAPPTGSLVVPRVVGLPPGVAALINVAGPRGFARAVGSRTRADTLDALVAGAYSVSAPDVMVNGERWAATPATQTITVGDGYRVVAQPVTYALASGRLTVQVLGLPSGAAAAIAVTGPGVTSRPLTGAGTIGPLDAGAYTVTASAVQAGGRTYRPAPSTQAATIVPGDTAVAVVDYGAGSATLAVTIDGLPAGTAAGVVVAGPGGYARTLDATGTLQNLEPGTYTVTTTTVAGSLVTHVPGTAATQSFTLAADGSAAAQVAFGSTALALGQQLVVEGLNGPVLLTAPVGDARLFIVERIGRIRIVKDGTLRVTPFLDISSRVNFAGERGLLGMAFDPAYATNGRFYAYYVDAASDLVLERFESTPGSDVASTASSLVLRIPHGRSEHHGGNLAFGPDGMLYLAPGDGGCCGDPRDYAQNTAVLLGKVLRIDVRTAPYAIPADNPYVGRADVRGEIWGVGLRSPWRFSFDPPTGRLYLADVGQDQREEISVVPVTGAADGGRNFGWPMFEGSSCYRPERGCSTTGLTMPVHEYGHDGGACSVTGGFVYRGSAIPELRGHYLYGDFCGGWIRSFRVQGRRAALTAGEHRSWPELRVPFIVSFGQDGAGELYMVANGGRVWRLVKR